MKKVGFPRIGPATDVVGCFLRDLGLEIILAPPITDRTVQLGVKNSPDMMCFPYKVTLGSMIELADLGADYLLQWNSGKRTLCRQKQYYRMQGICLAKMGYQCNVLGITPRNFVRQIAELSGKSKARVCREIVYGLSNLRCSEDYNSDWCSRVPNIGIIGEIYCCIEPGVNRNLLDLVRKHGGNPISTVTVTNYLMERNTRFFRRGILGWFFGEDKYHKKANRLFEGQMAGHACENMASLFRLCDKGIDGIIHVLPLTCMPESCIEEYMDDVCEKQKIPLLRLPLDETNSPANVETRVETFVKLIIRRMFRDISFRGGLR